MDRPQGVFVAVRFDAAILKVANDSIIWSGSASAERLVGPPRKTEEMDPVVQGLSTVAAELITQLVREASSALGRGSAVRAQSRP